MRFCLLLVLLLPTLAVRPGSVGAQAFVPTLPATVRGQDPMDPHPATQPIPPVAADYTITATVHDPDSSGRIQIDVTERVQLTNTSMAPVGPVTFNATAVHYGWFTLDGGTIDGTPAAVDQADVRLSFPEWPGIDPGAKRTVGFTFHLNVGDAGDGWDVTRRDGSVLRLAYWFPVLSDDHSYAGQIDAANTTTADYHVVFTAPAAQVLVSTGTVQKRETVGDQVRYTIEAPKVRDFAALLSPDYQVLRQMTKTGVMVEVYTIPSHYADSPDYPATMLADAVRSVEQMSAWVGPYPYPIYRLGDAGITMPGGDQFPMLSMLGARLRDSKVLVGHETAHQWFYSLLGNNLQTEPWIDEGAANFFEDAIFQGLAINPTLSRSLPCSVNATQWDGLSDDDLNYCVYNGGRKVYASMRAAMGNDAFVAALQDLLMTHEYGVITGRDVLTTFQKDSTVDLRPIVRPYFSYPWIDSLPAPGG